MPRGILIPADRTAPLEQRTFNRLEDYQAAVGGPIEAVDLPEIGVTIYANEIGVIQQLPVNSHATLLWWFGRPSLRRKAVLVGDVVVVGMPNRAGDTTDVPADLAQSIMNPHGHRVELAMRGTSVRYVSETVACNYFEAIVLAQTLLDHWPESTKARIVPRTELYALEDGLYMKGQKPW